MIKRIATIVLVLFSLSPMSFAQQGEPKIQLFAARVELNGEVHLAWTRLGMGTHQYDIFRAKVSDSSSFTLIDSTSDTTYTDIVPTGITDIADSYAYYIAVTHSGMTDKSNTIVLPVAGIPPIGSFRLEGEFLDSGQVKLTWDAPPINTPVYYYLVYMSTNMDEHPVGTKIDSTTNVWTVANVPSIEDPDEDFRYFFYVRAKLSTGEFLTSTLLQLTAQHRWNRDEVKFISRPPLAGQVNVPYVYHAQAVSSDSNAVIRYYANVHEFTALTVKSPFTMDSVTGVFTMTPQSGTGLYGITIVALSTKGGMARQNFAVSVGSGNGVISGKVSDTTGAGIEGVVLEAYKIIESFAATDNYLSFVYTTRTDANGKYRLGHLDPGTYKLHAVSPTSQYQSQWYDGVRSVNFASIITVLDSPAVTNANFTLRGGPINLPKVTVTGTVTDTAGLSLFDDSSRVIFVRAEFALNFAGGLDIAADNFRKYFEDRHQFHDFRLEGNSEFVFKARTDTSGHYSVSLVPGAYIALARARGYAVEFFNGKNNLLSADIIRITGDTSGVNFTLAPLPPVVLGEIKGAILDTALNIGVPSRVIAFRDRWRFTDRFHIGRVYVTDTDSLGMYDFSDLLPGTYVVMALPLGNYAPAFYSDDSLGLRWKRAGKIVVNGNSIDNINIYVQQLSPFASGFTRIHGTVALQQTNAAYGDVQGGSIVYAYRNGEIAGYAITAGNGNYSIDGLAPGTYTVGVDKVGFNEPSTVDASVGYSTSGLPLEATVDFSMTSVTDVSGDTPGSAQPTTYSLSQNYPNPFNPTTTINYSVPKDGNITLKVYNILGQEVATLLDAYKQAGTYSATFNARSLSSGIYFYRLHAGNFSAVKKMLLIK